MQVGNQLLMLAKPDLIFILFSVAYGFWAIAVGGSRGAQ